MRKIHSEVSLFSSSFCLTRSRPLATPETRDLRDGHRIWKGGQETLRELAEKQGVFHRPPHLCPPHPDVSAMEQPARPARSEHFAFLPKFSVSLTLLFGIKAKLLTMPSKIPPHFLRPNPCLVSLRLCTPFSTHRRLRAGLLLAREGWGDPVKSGKSRASV